MIRSIEVSNFRCFKRLTIDDVSRLNVIVGDNGVGKTALLEAIFLPLATSTHVPMRLRQQRGLEASFSGTSQRIQEALWGDFFHNYDLRSPVALILSGDGDENRRLLISKRQGEFSLPLSPNDSLEMDVGAPISFTWENAKGESFPLTPMLIEGRFQLPDTGEDLPNFFQFSASMNISSSESASRFSDLSKRKAHKQFIEIFTAEYPWIEDINIEVSAGSPSLYATLKGTDQKIPLPNVSGGINRVLGMLITIASRPMSVIVVDEIETGIYYKHHKAVWRNFLNFIKRYDGQLFVTTHSQECLEALGKAVDEKSDDVSLWRMERTKTGPKLSRFSGKTLKAGIKYGQEVR